MTFGRVAARERQGVLLRRAWQRSIGWVRTRFGDGGGHLDRRRARGGLNPCARESKARTERISEGKAHVLPRSFFILRGPQGAANGQYPRPFSKDARGFGRLDAGSRAGFTSSRPPPPWTSVFQFIIFLYNVWP